MDRPNSFHGARHRRVHARLNLCILDAGPYAEASQIAEIQRDIID